MASTIRCPICDQRDRAFYNVPNNHIVLLCLECSAVWLDPAHAGWGDASTEQVLCEHFGVTDSDQLFDDQMSGWATRHDVLQDQRWRHVLDRLGRARPDSVMLSLPSSHNH
ncbi:hypothetical protein TW95_gp0809 [Pandoravirus inopinatum]|uniref:Uncharacterized protein n=1 Tax=Pandoravirus inopinatum TaxID=1605721 RepID=A0A0B5IXN2_9VIRU|nr:hypothetical protein TW95_gp0809 [Pandoravirus inopinatum]AJF97543.1 hypothetical protein [Pandoravirus inopinatum]